MTTTEHLRTHLLASLGYAANYCLLEFARPQHPEAHWRAEDDHAHCPRWE